jgi:hypothetical protein
MSKWDKACLDTLRESLLHMENETYYVERRHYLDAHLAPETEDPALVQRRITFSQIGRGYAMKVAQAQMCLDQLENLMTQIYGVDLTYQRVNEVPESLTMAERDRLDQPLTNAT